MVTDGPRKRSADDYLRAVLSQRAAQSGELAVIRARRLPATDRLQTMVAMVWRVHLDASGTTTFTPQPAVTACYGVEFNPIKATLGPRRTTRPVGSPLTSVPGPAVALPTFPPDPENPLSPNT